ncbi:MAG: response regulator [Bacteroidota bacterium]|nr:response regulator [Bacteroidota bacterium]
MQYDWKDKVILIVEDSETVNMYFEAALRKTGAKLLWATNGKEAIDICVDNKDINLILMDLQLPKLDGYLATVEIRKIRKDLPIIAQTAHIFENAREKSLNAGCNDFITKPIRLSVLFSIVDKYI